MKFGYVKTGAFTPEIRVADVGYNTEAIKKGIDAAFKSGVELLVFPELCVTGYTCGDLFYQQTLLAGAARALKEIAEYTKDKNMLVFVGLPLKKGNLLYNTAAALNDGKVLAFVPKKYLPNYNEFYEKRYFAPCPEENEQIDFFGEKVYFGNKLLFCERKNERFVAAAEICEDLWAVSPPSLQHVLAGARIIANLSCSDELVGKAEYRESMIGEYSARTVCAYVYADAGEGESTTDAVFSGHNLIAENGAILKESRLFENGLTVSEVDLGFIDFERSKLFNQPCDIGEEYEKVYFDADNKDGELTRVYPAAPFVPDREKDLNCRAELILSMQAEGLKKRIKHTCAKCAVIGLSGGLDSTLAILVAVNAMKKLGRSPKDVIAVTMPCFGTTGRTYRNTIKLASALGVTLKKVDISKSVTRHFKDIKQPEGKFDVTFENAQARERTQVLMDIANMYGGMVVGTGDLSELALGWATYNGDHMSMYGVNASVPKTLVRHIVSYYAGISKGKLKAVLYDILDTPVSPELLPPENGDIAQKTEDIVGPYLLHDFYLYYFIRRGFSPAKIYYVAIRTFEGIFDAATVLKWLKTFFRRFFGQQFKRSCLPDGVKVGSVALSPRGDWRMPSDAVCALWLKELDELG